MQVIPPDNDGPHHFGTMASPSKDTAPDRNVPSEWTFLIDICTYKEVAKFSLSNICEHIINI